MNFGGEGFQTKEFLVTQGRWSEICCLVVREVLCALTSLALLVSEFLFWDLLFVCASLSIEIFVSPI